MMSDDIVRSCRLAANGRLAVPQRSGMCLAFVRVVLEHALFQSQWRLYERYLVARTSFERRRNADGSPDWTPYASDFEASMKALGFQVPIGDRQPGDLIFNHEAARPYGHIGILYDHNNVLENIRHDFRPNSILLHPHMALTPLEHFKYTLVARLERR
jgi:hypothetical protein